MLQPWGGGWSLELRYRAWSKSLKLLLTTWIRASYEISEYTGFIQAGCWEPNWWHPLSWESLLGRQWWLDHFEHQRYGAVFWCICEKCQGHKQIMIHSSDTDILVLAVSYVTELGGTRVVVAREEFWAWAESDWIIWTNQKITLIFFWLVKNGKDWNPAIPLVKRIFLVPDHFWATSPDKSH